MKMLSTMALASLVLALSSSVAMAANNFDITANENITTQIQIGLLNEQNIKLAVIASDVDSDVTITANRNNLLQTQSGLLNKQSINIATVGCNCK
ncbi:MAG: hypothetical protein KAH22_09885 [Thiotrichaceae bacterium]|nr:hypothetical protein [Thiotrichaceae bacterium]